MPKQKEAPLPPFALKVLTTQYVIEGTIAIDRYTDLYFREGEGQMPFDLTSARIQPLQTGGRPPRWAERVAVWGPTVVALIPEADAIERIVDALFGKSYNKPCPGVFYLGPYVMQGRLMAITQGMLGFRLPVFDVTITCELPGVEWAGVGAPFAVLNMHWLHAYEPA